MTVLSPHGVQATPMRGWNTTLSIPDKMLCEPGFVMVSKGKAASGLLCRNGIMGAEPQSDWQTPPELRSARSASVNLSRGFTRYSSWKYKPTLYIARGWRGFCANCWKRESLVPPFGFITSLVKSIALIPTFGIEPSLAL